MLRKLKATNPYPALEEITKTLVAGLNDAAEQAGLPHSSSQVGSMFTLFFNPEEVTSYTVSAKNNTERFAKYFWGMMNRGVYLPCSQYEANFVSAVHTNEDIEKTIAAAHEVMQEIA
jgi:glutamate-1-semialdehyde 2,1-aminomutase